MERKHGKTLSKVRKEPETIELKLKDYQVGYYLGILSLREARELANLKRE